MMTRLSVLSLALLAGCMQPGPPAPRASLPPTAPIAQGLGDPLRAAVLATAWRLNQGTLAGAPIEAAELLGAYEFMTVEIPADPARSVPDPLVPGLLLRGRTEARTALGMRADVPPQAAVDTLYGAAAALRAGDRARAEAVLAPTGASLARLAALPVLVEAGRAASRAQASMLNERQRDRGRDWF